MATVKLAKLAPHLDIGGRPIKISTIVLLVVIKFFMLIPLIVVAAGVAFNNM